MPPRLLCQAMTCKTESRPRGWVQPSRNHRFLYLTVFAWLLCVGLAASSSAQEPEPSSTVKPAASTRAPSPAPPSTPTGTAGSGSTPSSPSADARKPETGQGSAGNGRQDDATFIIVVHAKNEIEELDASRISKMFLKKIKRWADTDKTPVEPADQAQDLAVREAFTQGIHINKDLFAIKTYWQRMIFSGRMAPPPELRSDEEVLAFVRSRRGAIGYVSPGTDLGEGVKELKVSPEEK